MEKTMIAKSTVTINAPAQRIWEALTTPAQIKQYFFGTEMLTDWKVGSPILYKGTWEGKPFEDKGEVLEVEPPYLLRVTHFSPLAGKPDTPENYHTVTYSLKEYDGVTEVTIANDNNDSEESVKHSEQNWQRVLDSLKKFIEK